MLSKLFRKKNSTPPTSPSPTLEKFLKSMKIGYLEWHDGVGYDLKTLKKIRGEEIKQVETLLISRKDQDWRDVQALITLNTPLAIEAVKECLLSENVIVRLFAVKLLKEKKIVDRIEEIVVDTLHKVKISYGLTDVLALAKKYPTDPIKQKLLWCCINGNDEYVRIHCAAMTLYLHHKASKEFDKKQKIIFRFGNREKAKRIEAFPELCQIIKVNPDKYLSESIHTD